MPNIIFFVVNEGVTSHEKNGITGFCVILKKKWF